MESFENLTLGEIQQKHGFAWSGDLQAGIGRYGTWGYYNPGGWALNIPNTDKTFIWGCAVKFTSTTGRYPLALRNSDADTLISLQYISTRQIKIVVGAMEWWTTASFPQGIWYYMELKYYGEYNNSSFELRMNGVNVKSANYTHAPSGPYIAVGTYMNDNATYYDDLYVVNGAGSINNDFLGDIRVYTLYPTADTDTNEWIPSSGIDHYTLVDDTPSDSDATYVVSSGVGDIDLYTYSGLAVASGLVLGMQVNSVARKDDAGTRKFSTVLRDYSVLTSGDAFSVSDNYTFYKQLYDTHPVTSNRFTITELDGIEIGVKLEE